MQVHLIKEEQAGKRADIVVASYYPNYSRAALQKLFSRSYVTVGGNPIKPSYRLHIHDKLHINDAELFIEPAAISLPVLYEDDDVMVISKPAGVLTHSKGALNEEATVASFIRPMVSKELTGNRAGIVHRLDRATSGVIITAKTPEAMRWLQKQFAQRRTKKTYIAIVSGQVLPPEALIDIPIERNPKNPKTFRAGAHGKPAQTTYKVLQQSERYALLELKPMTGRTHQLRVHLRYLQHPIVGDVLYGGEPAERLFLHAQELEITLPNRQRKVCTAPLPNEFKKFMKG